MPRYNPTPVPVLNDDDQNSQVPDFEFMPVWSSAAFRRACQYPVIVENWDKRLHGSKRRKYHAAFTEKERATIARWQTKFSDWYLRSGTPTRVMMKLETFDLLRRAVHFFASV